VDNNRNNIYSVIMKDFLTDFGNKIRYYRELKNLSQEKFAEKIDVSRSTITSIETGKSFVKYNTIKKICTVLNVQPRDLFDFELDTLTKENEYAYQISTLSKNLSPDKQKHIIEILKTFQ